MKINSNSLKLPLNYSQRPAQKVDEKEIQELIFTVLQEYNLQPKPDTTDKDLFDIEDFYKSGYFGVISSDSKIIGTYAFLPLTKSCGELRKMYVLPEGRGKGLGSWMTNHVIEMAKENGYEEVELETASQMKEAIGLYLKLGFKEIQFQNKTPRCDKAFKLKL